MRKCKRLTAFILSAAMSLQLLSMGAVSASEVNEGEGSEPPAIVQEETVNPEEADSISADSDISVEDETEITTEEIVVTDKENTQSDETIVTEDVTGEEDIVKAAEDAVEITECGKEYVVSVSDADYEKWFKFVPTETGWYNYYACATDAQNRIMGFVGSCVYDHNMNQIEYPRLKESEIYGVNVNLTAGETYYLSLGFHSGYMDDEKYEYDLKIVVTKGVVAYVSGTKNKSTMLYIDSGQSATLSVDAVGSDITYLWCCDWNIIDGATGSSYEAVAPADSSVYQCVICDKFGNRDDIFFTIFINSPPELAAYATGTKETWVGLTANRGETKTLSVEVNRDDLSEISCQWYKYNPTTYENEPIAGANDLSYTTEIINDFGTNGSIKYQCVLSDANSSCYVDFNIYPSSQVEPFYAYASGTRVTDVTYNVTVGESKTLAVDVEGDVPTELSYAWEQYDNETYEYKPVAGETGDSLQIASVDASQRYRCTVTGNNQARTVVFKLNVNHFSAYISGTTKHNQILYVESGENLTLSADVTADDMSTVSYEWKKYFTDTALSTGNSIRLENITESADYTCRITDGYGNIVSLVFSINVNNQSGQNNSNNLKAFVSGTKKTSTSYQLGVDESVLLSVDVTADDMNGITYKWREWYNYYHTVYENVSNVNSIRVYDYDIYHSPHNYQCTVTDAYGNSVTVDFTVKAQNLLYAYAKNTRQDGITIASQKNETHQLAVDVVANSMDGISYSWYKGSDRILGENNPVITTDSVTKNTNYYCEVSDRYGNSRTVYFHIKVNNLRASVSGTTETEGTVLVDYNSTADLAVDVSADDMSGLTYTWYKGDEKNLTNYMIDGTSGKASITTDPVKREAWYKCKMTDSYGNTAEVYFRVGVENGLSAYVSGTTEITKTFFVTKGQTLTLKADATANDTNRLTYDWGRYIHNGKKLLWNSLNAFTDSYTIDSVIENETYRCRIIDKFGNCIDLIYKVYIKQFEDVKKSAYYCEAVSWALDKGITTGTSDTTFEPKNGCTRAQFVTFLWRSFGCPEPTRITQFSDVKKSAYYYKAVMWAAENGITTGYTGSKAGQFGPKDVCKREQCVTFLYRAAGSPVVTAEDHAEYGFTDVKRSGYYYDAITWAAKYGITTGISDTEFGRGQDCTRGQLVTFLQRFIYNTNYSTASFYKRDPFVDCSDGDY